MLGRSRPGSTVDAAVFSVAGGVLRVLLVERGKEPFRGEWAIPGGFVELGEDLPAAAARELAEETGVKVAHLEPLGSYGKPGRDPRGHVISHVFLGIVAYGRAHLAAGDDAADALWHPALKPPKLAFDHGEILADALAALRERVFGGDAAFRFLGGRFQAEELRGVFEAVLGKRIPAARFQAEMRRTGILRNAEGGLKRVCRKTFHRLLRERALFRF